MRAQTAYARQIHRDQGVGFWRQQDAQMHAALEQRRTGQPHAVTGQPSPFGSHEMWFVRPAMEAAA